MKYSYFVPIYTDKNWSKSIIISVKDKSGPTFDKNNRVKFYYYDKNEKKIINYLTLNNSSECMYMYKILDFIQNKTHRTLASAYDLVDFFADAYLAVPDLALLRVYIPNEIWDSCVGIDWKLNDSPTYKYFKLKKN